MTTASDLPHLVIGGAPRSGTTFLCEVLDQHPGVHVGKPFIPEPKVCMTPHPAGDAGLRDRYRDLFKDAPPGRLLVEKTSYYLENAEARERVVRVCPDAKFVFILREPVERAYSNWLWSTANKIETLSFADAIAAEGRRPSPLPPNRAYARPFDYMTRGNYGTFAEQWIAAVGRERIAFFVFEAALAALEPFAERLQRFAGVDPLPWQQLRVGRINANPLPGGEIDPALRLELRARIAPEVKRFAEVTGTDVSIWGY